MKCEFSVHDLTFILIKSKTAKPKQKLDTYVICDMKQFQHERFLEDINKLTNDINFKVHEKSTDEKFADFLKSFVEIVNSHAPLRHATRKKKRLKPKPWQTKRLLTSIHAKNRMFKRVRKNRDRRDDQSSEEIVQYKNNRNLLNRAISKVSQNKSNVTMIKLSLLETIRNGSEKLYMIYVTSKNENFHFHIN